MRRVGGLVAAVVVLSSATANANQPVRHGTYVCVDQQHGMPCEWNLVGGSRYGAEGNYVDADVFLGMLYVPDWREGYTGRAAVLWRDFGVSFHEGIYHNSPSPGMQSTMFLWDASLIHRIPVTVRNNLWIEAGVAGIDGEHGLQAAVRAEHRLATSHDLEIGAAARGLHLPNGNGMELSLTLQFGIIRVAYRVIDVHGTRIFGGPELGVSLRF
jgi:hypothetical protein